MFTPHPSYPQHLLEPTRLLVYAIVRFNGYLIAAKIQFWGEIKRDEIIVISFSLVVIYRTHFHYVVLLH